VVFLLKSKSKYRLFLCLLVLELNQFPVIEKIKGLIIEGIFILIKAEIVVFYLFTARVFK